MCGTTGKRKACKDCSCGLAEELDAAQKPVNTAEAKSSCGSVSNIIQESLLQFCVKYVTS